MYCKTKSDVANAMKMALSRRDAASMPYLTEIAWSAVKHPTGGFHGINVIMEYEGREYGLAGIRVPNAVNLFTGNVEFLCSHYTDQFNPEGWAAPAGFIELQHKFAPDGFEVLTRGYYRLPVVLIQSKAPLKVFIPNTGTGGELAVKVLESPVAV